MLASDSTVRDSVEVEVLSKDAQSLARLTLSPKPLTLAVRGPKGRFTVEAEPQGVTAELLWSALDASIVSVSPDGLLTPKTEGQGRIVVASRWDAGVTDTAWVHVLPPQKVDSVRFEKDALEVFVGGAPDSLKIQVHPPLANPEVTFSLADGALARIEGGKVEAQIEGETWAHARSVEDPTKRDSLRLIVFPKERVDSVRVKPDTLRLFVKGPPGALTASIHPSTLQERFSWSVTHPTLASVDGGGQVSPGAPGKTYVTASARADASKRDSALVLVVKDTPRLSVGGDTVVPVGATVTHHLQITQEYGEVVLFRWDLDGNGAYDDSATSAPATLSHTYAQPQVHTARFHVRDSEGNDTTVFRKVSAVEGRVVQIVSPKDSSSTNQGQIVVSWLVDGEPYTNAESLEPGANTLTRSAKDAAGHTFSHSVTVFLDQTAPSRPIVSGPAVPVNTLTPTWTWASGGGGSGLFRIRLGDPDLTASIPSPDTFFTAPTNLSEGTHTLYVQERDEAGNWSLSGSFAVRIDTTAPSAPTLSVSPSGVTNNPRPTWSWTGGAGDAYRIYRFKMVDDDFRSGGKDTVGTSYRPPALSEGTHTLFVQVRDSAGNWSTSASASVTVDLTPPTAPAVSVSPGDLTNDDTPTWSWRRGTGGNGTFRYKLNNSDFSTGGATTADTAYTPLPLGEGTYTLYIQERDVAGNWSLSGSRQVRLDLTAPSPPRLDSTPYSPLNSLRPRWTWRSGTGGAKVFRAKVDDPNLAGAAEQTDSTFTQTENLLEGQRTLYVQERDSAGNWSETSTSSLFLSSSGAVGPIAFANGTKVSIAVSKSGTPYIAYLNQDQPDGGTPVVKRFNGVNWEDVGTFDFYACRKIQIRIDANDIPYVVLGHATSSAWSLTMLRLVGLNWAHLGIPQLVTDDCFFEFELDAVGMPHIAFKELSDAPEDSSLVVKQYRDGNWVPISDRLANKEHFSIAFSADGRVSAAVLDDIGRDIRVFNLVGGKWVSLGIVGKSEPNYRPLISRNSSGHLFLSYYSEDQANRVKVVTNRNGAWDPVGSGSVTNSGEYLAHAPPIRTNESGLPTIGWDAVWTIRAGKWVQIGKPLNFRPSDKENFAFTKDGVAYLVFETTGALSVFKTSFDP
jgi:hypothetical protein